MIILYYIIQFPSEILFWGVRVDYRWKFEKVSDFLHNLLESLIILKMNLNSKRSAKVFLTSFVFTFTRNLGELFKAPQHRSFHNILRIPLVQWTISAPAYSLSFYFALVSLHIVLLQNLGGCFSSYICNPRWKIDSFLSRQGDNVRDKSIRERASASWKRVRRRSIFGPLYRPYT